MSWLRFKKLSLGLYLIHLKIKRKFRRVTGKRLTLVFTYVFTNAAWYLYRHNLSPEELERLRKGAVLIVKFCGIEKEVTLDIYTVGGEDTGLIRAKINK